MITCVVRPSLLHDTPFQRHPFSAKNFKTRVRYALPLSGCKCRNGFSCSTSQDWSFGKLGNRRKNWDSEANGNANSLQIGPAHELGGGSDDHTPIGVPNSCGFTTLQLQELKLHSLIYSYIESGSLVPNRPVVLIWKSVAHSLSCHDAGLYHQPFGLGWVSESDAEPGRCRRSGGKKWKCSKEAVPDHKYCERHMHIGRHRLRKLVKASQGGANAMLSISLPPYQ